MASTLNHRPEAFPRRRVVITGLGPITCVGVGKDALWGSILAGRGGISRITRFDTAEFYAHCGGEIRDWDPTQFFPPHRLKRLDRYAQFAVASALLALDDAKLAWSRERPQQNVGVSFGTALGGISNAESEHQRFLKRACIKRRFRKDMRDEIPGGIFARLWRDAVLLAQDFQNALKGAATLAEAVSIVSGTVVLKRAPEFVVRARIRGVGER